MTTPVTPQFALPYLEEGAPFYLIRQRYQAAMEQLDAVLATKAVTPPGAGDLLTVANRVTALENDQAAEDARAAPQAVTFATNWAQFTNAPYGELVKAWKLATGEVRVAGIVMTTGGIATASSTAQTMFTLPAGHRPAVQLLRSAWYQSSLNPPIQFRLHVLTTGAVAVVPHQTINASAWLQLDFTFRTVNT